ncbi:MAG: pyridoxal phosphate-dependent aminotransferase [Lachnospiraceae bacterium]|nr:pyridoxal phosphate-dependent aminotransferase [Lachnospiraceae bacterium]
MNYNFDKVPDRRNTFSHKWDYNKFEFPERPDAIPMWVADMDFPCPVEIVNAVRERAEHPIYGYGTMAEDSERLVAAWQKSRHGWEIAPSWVTYTNGVVPALSMAVRAFAEAGEGVIIMSPVYYPFHKTVVNNSRVLRKNYMKYDGKRWGIDFDELEKLAAMPDTKLLVLCNPHNPLCRVFEKEELLKIGEICLKHHVLIMADEIHEDLVFKGYRHIPIASLSSEISNITITATAPSKTFNIAGLQMSAIICENEELKEKFLSALGFDCIPSIFGAVGLKAAYGEPGCVEYLEQVLDYMWENYQVLDQGLKEKAPKIHVQKPEATYLMWLDCRELGLSDEELYHFFVNEAGVGIEMGHLFGEEITGYVRMNIGCNRATIHQCIKQIEEVYVAHGF